MGLYRPLTSAENLVHSPVSHNCDGRSSQTFLLHPLLCFWLRHYATAERIIALNPTHSGCFPAWAQNTLVCTRFHCTLKNPSSSELIRSPPPLCTSQPRCSSGTWNPSLNPEHYCRASNVSSSQQGWVHHLGIGHLAVWAIRPVWRQAALVRPDISVKIKKKKQQWGSVKIGHLTVLLMWYFCFYVVRCFRRCLMSVFKNDCFLDSGNVSHNCNAKSSFPVSQPSSCIFCCDTVCASTGLSMFCFFAI